MFSNFKFSKWILIGLSVLVAITLIIWSTDTFSAKRCKNIVVNIANNEESFFVTEQDVKRLVTQNGTQPLIGKSLERINLKELEGRVKTNRLVKNCQIYRDLKGNLNIDIEQEKPIARLSSPNRENDCYINADGQFLPLSNHFSAKILIVSGTYFNDIISLKAKKHKNFLSFINFIDSDAFWKSQVTQIDIDTEQNIKIVPLVGKHIIEFGNSENYQNKLHKLTIFYNQITTVKGWENFNKISVKFKDQIVCE